MSNVQQVQPPVAEYVRYSTAQVDQGMVAMRFAEWVAMREREEASDAMHRDVLWRRGRR